MFKPGTYWVGDLEYFLPDDVWEKVSGCPDGEYFLEDGRQCCIYKTKFGRAGVFCDDMLREYFSVSGSLGCIELNSNKKAVPAFGHVIKFNTHFQTGFVDDSECVIFFGDLEINTAIVEN